MAFHLGWHSLIDLHKILLPKIEPLTLKVILSPLETISWLSGCFRIRSLVDTTLVLTWLDFGTRNFHFGTPKPLKILSWRRLGSHFGDLGGY